MTVRTPRLAVLVSGSGRSLENLLARTTETPRRLDAIVRTVVASRPCRGAEIARAAGVETHIVPGEIPADQLEQLADGCDLICCAGYLKRVCIPPAFEGRILNIHPSLLPAFGGPGMYGHRVHEAVLTASQATGGPRESGCTVHVVTDVYDDGPPVLQRRCPIEPADTPETLAARVFALELDAFPDAITQHWAAVAG